MKHIKKFFELVDYKKLDIEDSDVYSGNLYLYSKDPVKLDDLKNEEGYIGHPLESRIYPYNRADASDTESEYIYQIKVKKPLYKRQMDFIFLMDSPDIVEEDFSGYFYKQSITGEWLCKINPKDIIDFRYIGGFTKYDEREKPERLDIKLSEETDDWLYSYIASGSLRLDKLTEDIIKELEPFRPKIPIKLYKGIEEVQIKHFSEVKPPYKKGQIITSDFRMATSWTNNILIARRFVDDYPSTTPFVIMMLAQPQDILVDVQKLPKQYYHTDQREFILLPGKYTYKIVWSD